MICNDRVSVCPVLQVADDCINSMLLEQCSHDDLELGPSAAFTARFADGRLAEISCASNKIYEVLGLKPIDVKDSADPFLTRIFPSDIDQFILSAVYSARSMEPWCVNFRFDHYVKGEIWVEWRANPIFKNYELIWDGVMLDFTEQKRSQRMLHLLESALDNMSDGSLVIDRQGNILEANRSICEMLGFNRSEIIGSKIFAFSDEFSQEKWSDHWEEIVNAGYFMQIETVIYTRLGYSLDVNVSINLFKFEDEVYNLSCVRDISNLKGNDGCRLVAASAFEASREGVVITDKEVCIQDVNPAFSLITGYSFGEVIGNKPNIISSGEHDKLFYKAMWSSLKNEGSWSGEIRNRHKKGRLYTAYLSIQAVRDDVGDIKHYIGSLSDISQIKNKERYLQYLAYHDALTNLPNRLMLSSLLSNALAAVNKNDSLLGVLCLDLDGFKPINDDYGHEVGDKVLVEVSRRLLEQTRSTDKVVRVGGDEFVVLLVGVQDAEVCAHAANRLLDAIAKPIVIGEDTVDLTVSIGICLQSGESGGDTDVLIRHANQAMCMAKSGGRNQYVFFGRSRLNDNQESIRTVHELRRGLKNDQFAVYYQPIIDLATGRVTKAEALVRWKHPKHGMVPPSEFIPIAENGGLINEIGGLVFRNAARVAYTLNSYEEIGSDMVQISINRSPRQFLHRDGVDQWIDYLRAHNIPGELIGVEITEGLLLDDRPNVLQQLNLLRSNGISISLDDFGTGYSALSYLTKFKIDYLKIDRSFVKDIVVDTDYRAIVNSIIHMAKQIGIQTIGEGIETEEQRDMLKAAGCDMAQGFLYARPMPENEFIEFVLTNRAWEFDICNCI